MEKSKSKSTVILAILVVVLVCLLIASTFLYSLYRRQYLNARMRADKYLSEVLNSILTHVMDPSAMSEEKKASYLYEMRKDLDIAMDLYSWELPSRNTSRTNTDLYGVLAPLTRIFNSDAWLKMDDETANMLHEYCAHILYSHELPYDISELFAKLKALEEFK